MQLESYFDFLSETDIRLKQAICVNYDDLFLTLHRFF
jgi:hypothetical protein